MKRFSRINAEPTENQISVESFSDVWFLAHIVAKGDEGACFVGGSHFVQGIGGCNVLIAEIEDTEGQIKITPLSDISNSIEIDGSNRVAMLGFIGFYCTQNGVYINGLALVASI